MNHGQNIPNLKQSLVYKSEKREKPLQDHKKDEKKQKSRIITVNKTSLAKEKISSLTPQTASHQEDCWKTINSSSPNKASTPSHPVLFWEVLMTVALLIMALWMQGLPSRQTPHYRDRDSLPSFEITKPQMGF
ncbi:MAG: hypothetical protein AB4060_21225 [Crocosphaera sp.]